MGERSSHRGGALQRTQKGSQWAAECHAQSLPWLPPVLPHYVGGVFSIRVSAVLVGKDEARIC